MVDIDNLFIVIEDDDDDLELRILRRLDRLLNQNRHISSQLRRIMGEQENIDAAVAQLGVDVASLNDAAVRIQAEIAALEAQGVDTTGLRAAIGDLDTAVGNVGSIVPVVSDGDTGDGASEPGD